MGHRGSRLSPEFSLRCVAFCLITSCKVRLGSICWPARATPSDEEADSLEEECRIYGKWVKTLVYGGRSHHSHVKPSCNFGTTVES